MSPIFPANSHIWFARALFHICTAEVVATTKKKRKRKRKIKDELRTRRGDTWSAGEGTKERREPRKGCREREVENVRSGAGGEQIEYRVRVERVLEESKEATKRKVLSRRCRKQEHEKKKKQNKKKKERTREQGCK